jgi:hypothetical protein
MRCHAGRYSAVVLLFAIAAVEASGQATGLPTFFAPTRAFGSSELGATLSRPGGDATGIEGRFGAGLNRADLAIRAGFVDPGGGGDGSFVAGVEARIPVLGRTSTFPLDGSFILGVGRHFADGGGQTFVPVGLTLGRRLSLDGQALQLTPYAQPTVLFADDALVAMGLGIDLRIRGIPEIRMNWAIGDMDGFSISLFWAS